MPEESYLYRYLNAEETLDFYGRLFNLPAAERRHRVELLLEMVGLTHQRKRPIVEYSKGMARRIGLAQALINDPDLIFLDEPTTGLDPTGTREIKDLILELRRPRERPCCCAATCSRTLKTCATASPFSTAAGCAASGAWTSCSASARRRRLPPTG